MKQSTTRQNGRINKRWRKSRNKKPKKSNKPNEIKEVKVTIELNK